MKEARQYLSFHMDNELFALDIARVREVIEHRSVTKVPNMPEFVTGVLNLRGGAVVVVDLKKKFGMGKTNKTINTCVIITEIMVSGEPVVLGAMADAVDEVFTLDEESIEPAPSIGGRLHTEFLKGMGKKDNEFILILDADRVFSAREMGVVQQMSDGDALNTDLLLQNT